MRIFEIVGDEIKITPEVLMVKEFKELWKKDKTKGKEKVKQQLSYVYYFCDWESPYAKYTEDDRQEKIVNDLGMKQEWIKGEDVKIAISRYEQLTMTTSMLLLQDAKVAVNKLRGYFREVDLAALDKNDKPIYRANDLTSNLKAIGGVIKGLKELEDEVKKEKMDTSSIKGGGQKGYFEDDDI
tara:strand:- start:3426 stop:3974 length:549 start_codon:yes stop_codon:yes gene_type:complete